MVFQPTSGVFARGGDSGGAVFIDQTAVGTITGGSASISFFTWIHTTAYLQGVTMVLSSHAQDENLNALFAGEEPRQFLTHANESVAQGGIKQRWLTDHPGCVHSRWVSDRTPESHPRSLHLAAKSAMHSGGGHVAAPRHRLVVSRPSKGLEDA